MCDCKKILDRLDKIDDHLDGLNSRLHTVERNLFGKPSGFTAGVVVRLDKLERDCHDVHNKTNECFDADRKRLDTLYAEVFGYGNMTGLRLLDMHARRRLDKLAKMIEGNGDCQPRKPGRPCNPIGEADKPAKEKTYYPRHAKIKCPVCQQSHTVAGDTNWDYYCVACQARWTMKAQWTMNA